MAPLVDQGTDCEDELSTPAVPPVDVIHRMDSELEEVFGDVGSLPTMVTPVCDIDVALCVSPAEGPVIAPPAVSAFVIRPSMATSPAGPKTLSAELFHPSQLMQDTQGCLFRMASYDVEAGGPNFSPAYGVQLHD